MTPTARFRYPKYFLIALLLLSQVALAAPSRHPAYSLMLEAAKRQKRAEAVLYLQKLALGLFDGELDPHRTGLIGVEYSTITTTLGSLKAKRTAANPDFAAYVVRVLTDHGIGAGDSVLVTMTGSFPGMNLAALVALETLNVSSLRVCSLGASSYGANQEAFTWLDIEDTLYRDGMLMYRSDFVTLGGTGDVGGGLPVDSKRFLRRKADSLGYSFLKSRSLKTQSALRREQLGLPRGYALLYQHRRQPGDARQGQTRARTARRLDRPGERCLAQRR